MTTPHGYADYRRDTVHTGRVFYNVAARALPATETTTRFLLATEDMVTLRAQSAVLDMSILVEYFDQPTGGTQLTTIAAMASAGTDLRMPLPILGPYCQVTFTPAAGVGCTYTSIIHTVHERSFTPITLARTRLIARDAVAILAGATVNNNAAVAATGDAWWTGYCTAAVWSMYLMCMDTDGFWYPIDKMTNAHKDSHRAVYIPPYPCRISVTNGDAVPQTFDAFLNLHPVF